MSGNGRRPRARAGAGIIIVALAIAGAYGAAAQQPPKDLLAAQIRSQGYRCDKVISARRDLARSKPDQAAWLLRCEKNTYRVTLIPDQAARVERLK
jgi:hypothetical protein